MAKNSDHYIDNKLFYSEMIEWKIQVKSAEETDDPKPPVTQYIGECFLLIAERLSTRPNFVNYPFREEMVGDAIENCLMYAGNFTQITYYAFLRRIQREKKQDHIKYKLMEAADAKGELAAILDPDGANKNPYAAHLRLTDNDIVNMEPKKKRKKRAKGSTGDGELF